MSRLALALILTTACATVQRGTPSAANEAVSALQASEFERARAEAESVLARFPGNARARVVAGLTLYKETMHAFFRDAMTAAMAALRGGLNHRYLRWSMEQTESGLSAVDAHLAVAAGDPGFDLDLCLACWRYDWNRDGEIDWRDETVFQVEVDQNGDSIPEDDPRRRPTFRFDVGDVHWARAMVAFQRTALNILLAYRWTELDTVLQDMRSGGIDETRIVIRLSDPDRIRGARDILLAGLDPDRIRGARDILLAGLGHADAARRAYLAETDDEREWVPNPRQHDHPLPLPVDQALYDTWAGVLADLSALVRGETGLSVAELAQLGDHQWADPPGGFIHVGRLFEAPGDIVLDLGHIETLDHELTRTNVERVLSDLFGDKYVPQMAPTGLIARLTRMKNEVQGGQESLERKLRYLFWIN